jgi:hypothetical protein
MVSSTAVLRRLVIRRGTLTGAAVLTLSVSGCAGQAASSLRPGSAPRRAAAAVVVGPRGTFRAGGTSMHQLVVTAKRRWAIEQYGPPVHVLLRRVAAEPGLTRALRSRDPAAARAYVHSRFRPSWYHWHVSRLRIVRGSRMLVDVGVPFVVAPSQLALPGTHGAMLQISDQDVIGYVKFMRRNHGVDIVTRGTGVGHVRTSLPAALHVRLPDRGSVTIAARRYAVASFHRKALNGERVKVWVLARS